MEENNEIILCCGNCKHIDIRRYKDKTIRCKEKHEYVPLSYYCEKYDFGDEWFKPSEVIDNV